MSNSYSDASGHPVSFTTMAKACLTTHGHETGVRLSCLAAKGCQFTTTYQPDSRFWPIQGIETGILIGAAGILLFIATWWTARRIS